VEEAKPRVRELTLDAARELIRKNPQAILLDVREDHEWAQGHAEQAQHLGKGIIERDMERLFPDKQAQIIMYCGGGFRSILTADAAQKMGYANVFSLEGGYKALLNAGWAIKKPQQT
jgi:rhodanese-related sulfurtransferase